MLTDDQKAHVRQEELYRQEVRLQLAPPTTRIKQVVELLSVPFVLWLLSSLVISAITYYVAGLEERSSHGRLVRRLGTEILVRLDKANLHLDSLAEGLSVGFVFSPEQHIYSEYDGLDIVSVVSILRFECENAGQDGDRLLRDALSMVRANDDRDQLNAAEQVRTLIANARPLVRNVIINCQSP